MLRVFLFDLFAACRSKSQETMKSKESGKRRPRQSEASSRKGADDLPFEESVGYQVRTTHRALQRFLQIKIEPYGVTLGMWYFLRALWHEDGLTQRELSKRIGTMEPTTLSAIRNMESRGLVRRVQNKTDRRKWHVCLTPKAQALRRDLIPLARDVVRMSVSSLAAREVQQLLRALAEVQKNIAVATIEFEERELSDSG
jgi:DNA-binding MarR family transcriptional regulator